MKQISIVTMRDIFVEAKLLIERGWTKGTYHTVGIGKDGKATRCYCLAGAIHTACEYVGIFTESYIPFTVRVVLDEAYNHIDDKYVHPADKITSSHANDLSIVSYNDNQESVDGVLHILDKAIMLCNQKAA